MSDPGVNVRPYLPHAVAATLWVFALPGALVFGLLLFLQNDPPVLATSALSVGLSACASVIGTWMWARNVASRDISFGDLMVWGWYRRKRAEEKLHEGTKELGLDRRGQPLPAAVLTRDRQVKVLHQLNKALEDKDPYTRGHAARVERHVYRTAAAMGLSVHDLEELRMAAELHDIGKIRVPDRIIRKPGPLTDDERELMEEHSVVGAWMLSHVASLDVIEAVRFHHERWDGKGYPDGLFGTDIPLYARIIAVADTFDAITSTRPYRARSEREHALAVLREETGKQFDPMCVEAFVSALPTRVPVTALLMLAPGAGKVLREVSRAFKRAGAASLAGGIGAASATAIISATAIVPAIDPIPVRAPEPVVRVVSGDDAEQAVIDVASSGDAEDLTSDTPVTKGRSLRLASRPTARVATVAAVDSPEEAGSVELAEEILDTGIEEPTGVVDDILGVGSDAGAALGNGKNKEKDNDQGNGRGRDDGSDDDIDIPVDIPVDVPDVGNGNGNGHGPGTDAVEEIVDSL